MGDDRPMDSSSSPLLTWRPFFWMPARLSAMALNEKRLVAVLRLAIDTVLLVLAGTLAWIYRTQLAASSLGDVMVCLGLLGVAHLALAVYLPRLLFFFTDTSRWWLCAGRVPVNQPLAESVNNVFELNSSAASLLLHWLIEQRLEEAYAAHTMKLVHAFCTDRKPTGLPSPDPQLRTLADVHRRARAHVRQEFLDQALLADQATENRVKTRL